MEIVDAAYTGLPEEGVFYTGMLVAAESVAASLEAAMTVAENIEQGCKDAFFRRIRQRQSSHNPSPSFPSLLEEAAPKGA